MKGLRACIDLRCAVFVSRLIEHATSQPPICALAHVSAWQQGCDRRARPIKGRLGLYVFLLDFEGHRADPQIATVIDELRGMLKELKVFGSYPQFPLEQFDDLYAPPGLL